MLSERLGALLKTAREERNLSREELARRGDVSTRLVAELERGQRPNVSLESALRLLRVVGVSVVAKAPNGARAEIRSAAAATLERAARAARRRQTWTGSRIHLHDEGNDPQLARSLAKRVAAVSQVSQRAYLVATAGRGQQDRIASRSDPGIAPRANTQGRNSALSSRSSRGRPSR